MFVCVPHCPDGHCRVIDTDTSLALLIDSGKKLETAGARHIGPKRYGRQHSKNLKAGN